MGLIEWFLLVALSVLWGGSFFFVEVAVDVFGPLTIVALRVGLAAVALNVIVVAMGLSMPNDRKLWAAFLGMGVFNNVIPFSLIVWGQAHITSGLASILNASTPFFTVVAAHYLTSDERMTGGRFVGVMLGISGVAYIMGAGALEGLATNTLAQAAILGAAISYAFAGIFGRRFRHLGCSALVTAAGQVTISAVVLLPLAFVVERPWVLPMPTVEVWGAVLGLALLSTALAYILYFRILATAGATNLLLVTFLVPISAILLGTAVLGEQLKPQHVAGIALIGLGLAAIDGRPLGIIRRMWSANRRQAEPTDRGD